MGIFSKSKEIFEGAVDIVAGAYSDVYNYVTTKTEKTEPSKNKEVFTSKLNDSASGNYMPTSQSSMYVKNGKKLTTLYFQEDGIEAPFYVTAEKKTRNTQTAYLEYLKNVEGSRYKKYDWQKSEYELNMEMAKARYKQDNTTVREELIADESFAGDIGRQAYNLGANSLNIGLSSLKQLGGVAKNIRTAQKTNPFTAAPTYIENKTIQFITGETTDTWIDKYAVEPIIMKGQELEDKYAMQLIDPDTYEFGDKITWDLLKNPEFAADSINQGAPTIAAFLAATYAAKGMNLPPLIGTVVASVALQGGAGATERMLHNKELTGEITLNTQEEVTEFITDAAVTAFDVIAWEVMTGVKPTTAVKPMTPFIQKIAKALFDTAKRTGSEVSTEAVQEMLPQIIDYASYEAERQGTFGEMMGEAWETGKQAGAMAFYSALPMSGVSEYVETKADNEATTIFNESVADVQGELKTINPETFIEDGKLNTEIVDARITDMVIKMERMNIEFKNKHDFVKNMQAQDYATYEEFATKAAQELEHQFKNAIYGPTATVTMIDTVVGPNDEILIYDDREKEVAAVPLPEQVLYDESDEIIYTDATRFVDDSSTQAASAIAVTAISDVQAPTKSELVSEVPTEVTEKEDATRAQFNAQVDNVMRYQQMGKESYTVKALSVKDNMETGESFAVTWDTDKVGEEMIYVEKITESGSEEIKSVSVIDARKKYNTTDNSVIANRIINPQQGRSSTGVYSTPKIGINKDKINVQQSKTLEKRIAEYEAKLKTAKAIVKPFITGQIKRLNKLLVKAKRESELNTYVDRKTVRAQVLSMDFLEDVDIQEVREFISPDGRVILGSYYNGIIKYAEDPHNTTLPHEAFHAFANLVLTDAQYEEAIVYIMKRDGLTDIKIAEEVLAQEFAEWFVSEKRPTNKFQKTLQYLKNKLLQLLDAQTELEALFSEVLKPSQKIESKELNDVDTSLLEEAKNYNSFEEFAKAQGPIVYHGTGKRFVFFDNEKLGSMTNANSAKEGFFFSSDREVAEAYAALAVKKKLLDAGLSEEATEGFSEAKIIIPQNKQDLKIVTEAVQQGELVKIDDDVYKPEGFNADIKEVVLVGDFKTVDFKKAQRTKGDYAKVSKKAKEEGYDGIILKNVSEYPFPQGPGYFEDVHIVFDSKHIKTEDQLINIWQEKERYQLEMEEAATPDDKWKINSSDVFYSKVGEKMYKQLIDEEIPDFVPEHLRDRAIIDKVVEHLDMDTMPTEPLQLELYKSIKNTLNNRLGVKSVVEVEAVEEEKVEEEAPEVAPYITKKPDKKKEQSEYKANLFKAAQKYAYDLIEATGGAIENAAVRDAMINKAIQEIKNEVAENPTKNSIKLINYNIKRKSEYIKEQQAEADVIFDTYYQRVRADVKRFEQNNKTAKGVRYKDAPEWYKKRSPSEKIMQEQTLKEIRKDAGTMEDTDAGEIINEKALRFMQLQASIKSTEAIIEAQKNIMKAGKDIVTKHIELAKGKKSLDKQVAMYKKHTREDARVKTADALIMQQEIMIDDRYKNAFKNLTKEKKAEYESNPVAFVENLKDPYLMKKKNKSGDRYILVDGSLVDNYTDKKYVVVESAALAAEKEGMTMDGYLADKVIENKELERLKARRASLFDQLLKTEGYIDLLKEINLINRKQEVLISTYENPNDLAMLLRERSITEAVKITRDNYKAELVKEKKIAQAKAKQTKTEYDAEKVEALNLRRERNEIFRMMEVTYNANNLGANVGENLLYAAKQKIKAKYGSNVTPSRNLYTMSNEDFDALIEKELLPLLEKASRVANVVNYINYLIDSKNIVNAKNIKNALGLGRIPTLNKTVNSIAMLEQLHIKELTLYMNILENFGNNELVYPAAVIEKQIRALNSEEGYDINSLKDDVIFTQEDFIEWVRSTYKAQSGNDMTREEVLNQLKRLQKRGYNPLDYTTGDSHLRIKDSITSILATELMAVNATAKDGTDAELLLITRKLRAARKSREESLLVKKGVKTNDIVAAALEALPEDRTLIINGQSKYGHMTETEGMLLTWIRDDFYGSKAKFLVRNDGMLTRDNYMTHMTKRLKQYIKDQKGAFKIIKGMYAYANAEDVMEFSFHDLVQNNYGKFISTKSHFEWSKERVGDMTNISTDLGLILTEYSKAFQTHKALTEQMPMIASHIDMIVIAEQEDKEGNKYFGRIEKTAQDSLMGFWLERADKVRGITPEKTFLFKQGGRINRTIRMYEQFLTLKVLGLRLDIQIISAISEFMAAGRTLGYPKFIYNINLALVDKTKGLGNKFLGLNLNRERAANIDVVFEKYRSIIGMSFWESFTAENNTNFKKFKTIALAGYTVTSHAIAKVEFMALLTEKEIETGVVTPERIALIAMEITKDRYIGGLSESPLGLTAESKALFKFQHWGLPMFYNAIEVLRVTNAKLGAAIASSDSAASDKAAHISNKDIKKLLIKNAWAATEIAILVTILEGFVRGLLPEDPQDDEYWQYLIRRGMQDAFTTIGGIITISVKSLKLSQAVAEAHGTGADKDVWTYLREQEDSDMDIYLNMFSAPGETSVMIYDTMEFFINDVARNLYLFANPLDLDIDKSGFHWRTKDKDERAKNLEKGLYNTYIYFTPTLIQLISKEINKGTDYSSSWNLQPEMVTATKEDRANSKEVLGHTWGFDPSQKQAYELYEKQSGMSQAMQMKQVNQLLASDSELDNNIGHDLLVMYVNEPFAQNEKQLLTSMSSTFLKGDDPHERNTNELRATALNMYLQMLPDDKSREVFYNKIANNHVQAGLIDAEVLNRANAQYDAGYTYNNEELQFMNFKRHDGQRAHAITNYVDTLNITEEQTDVLLNSYIDAGFIDEETRETIEQWHVEKFGVK